MNIRCCTELGILETKMAYKWLVASSPGVNIFELTLKRDKMRN